MHELKAVSVLREIERGGDSESPPEAMPESGKTAPPFPLGVAAGEMRRKPLWEHSAGSLVPQSKVDELVTKREKEIHGS